MLRDAIAEYIAMVTSVALSAHHPNVTDAHIAYAEIGDLTKAAERIVFMRCKILLMINPGKVRSSRSAREYRRRPSRPVERGRPSIFAMARTSRSDHRRWPRRARSQVGARQARWSDKGSGAFARRRRLHFRNAPMRIAVPSLAYDACNVRRTPFAERLNRGPASL